MAKKLKQGNFRFLNEADKNLSLTEKTQIIYCSPDKEYNKVTFSFLNASNEAIALNKQTTLNFNMPTVLADTAVADLNLVMPAGWEASKSKTGTWTEWKLSCTADAELAAGKSIDFGIGNIFCETYDGGNFYITSSGISGYDDLTRPISLLISILRPPVDPKKANPLPFTAGYSDVIHPIGNQTVFPDVWKDLTESPAVPVIITYDGDALIRNGFTLLLTNNGESPIELKNTDKESERPAVVISFLFGDREYDITEQRIADRQLRINVNQTNWDAPLHTDGSPSWKFYPALPQHIDSKKTISFFIKDIITPVDIPDGDISIMYVRLNKFGNFDDKLFTFQLQKVKAKAAMHTLSVAPDKIDMGQNVKLSWRSRLAKRVTLSYLDRDSNPILLDSASPDQSSRIELDADNFELPKPPSAEYTDIIATAYDKAASELTKHGLVRVVQPQAEIKWFKVSEQIILKGSKPKITFTWEVSDTVQLALITRGSRKIVTGTSAEVEFDGAFEYSLLAYSYGTQLKDPVEKKVKVFTYQNEETAVSVPLSGEKAVRPVIVLSSNQRLKRVFVQYRTNMAQYNTIYEVSTEDFSLMKQHNGRCFALNQAGTKLAFYRPALEKGRRGVVLYDIASGKESMVEITDAANAMRFSPDGKKLFVSFEFGILGNEAEIIASNVDSDADVAADGPRYAAYFKCDADKNTLERIPTRNSSIGNENTAIAFDNSVSTVYFSSYANRTDDGNLFLINYNDGEPATTQKIDLGINRVILLKEAKKSNKIFACSDRSHYIVIIDTSSNSCSVPYHIGDYPSDMILSADEKTVYIACLKENKIVAFDTATSSARDFCTGINTPSCLALSADEEILFAGNHQARTISMIDVKTGRLLVTVPTGAEKGYPFGIVIVESADAYRAFVAKDGYSELHETVPNKGLDVSVISIQKPAPKMPADGSGNNHEVDVEVEITPEL